MNFQRIQDSIDIPAMQRSHVGIVGGAAGLALDLVRCGVGKISHYDFDQVDETNPARQDFDSTAIGKPKTQALAEMARRINPDVKFRACPFNFCALPPLHGGFGDDDCDLWIFATDRFYAQARGNLQAIRLNTPAMWLGLYRDGGGGEIIYTLPGQGKACYRCIASSRYAAFYEQARIDNSGLAIPSSGAIIADLHFVDAIATQIAIGILTAGADNRFGRLIAQLGGRNIIQCKLNPEFRLGEPDIFESHLGRDPAQFAFSTIALAIEPDPDCPDCQRKGAGTPATPRTRRATCRAS